MVDPATQFGTVATNRWLGLELRAAAPGAATVVLTPRPEFAQIYGVVHGGVLATLADTAAVYAIHPYLESGERMTSIEFKVNFLAPANVAGGEIVAESRVAKRGRTVAVTHVDVRQGGTLVLTGIFTYIVMSAS